MGATLLPGAITSINVVVLRIQSGVLAMTGDLGDSLFLATSTGFERQVGSGCVGDILYFQFSLTTDPSISLLTGRILLFLHSVALLAL